MILQGKTAFTILTVNFIIIVIYSSAVSFYTGVSIQSLIFNRLMLAVLPAAAAGSTLFSIRGMTGAASALSFLFLLVNSFYIFIYGLSLKLFNTEITPGIILYILENVFILLEDTFALFTHIPIWYWLIFIITLSAGYKSEIILRSLSKFGEDVRITAEKVSAVIILFIIVTTFFITVIPFIGEKTEYVKMPGFDFAVKGIKKEVPENCFKKKNGLNIDDDPDIVIFILESVGAAHFNPEKSDYLKKGEPVLSVENFFVPVPHTTVSIYSLITGNYGDYRGRTKPAESDRNNSLPAILKSKGYSALFLYSGPTFFEGLHAILENAGFTVYNKEYLESEGNYQSFSWGVDDAALLHKSMKILPGLKSPAFFVIGFSATHSPYFNPDESKFNRYDNESEKGRYLNSIEYDIFIMDRIIELFLLHNDNTIFIILGDHGESFGEEGFWRHGFSLYNSEIKVPFYIRHPVFSESPVIRAGTILDVYPTLLDMLGIKVNAEINGKSIFCSDYRLNLFLRSWKEGENKGLISDKRKWIYSRKGDRLLELDLNDKAAKEILDPGVKRGFLDFINSEY